MVSFNKDLICTTTQAAELSAFPTTSFFADSSPLLNFPDMPGKPELEDWMSNVTSTEDFSKRAIETLQTEMNALLDELSLTFEEVDADTIDSIDFSLGDLDIAGLSTKMDSFNAETHNIKNKINSPFFNLINMGRQAFKRFPVMPAITKGVISGAENGTFGCGPVNFLYHLSDQQPEQKHFDAFINMISSVQTAVQADDFSNVQGAMSEWLDSINARLKEDPDSNDGFTNENETFTWIALNISCSEIPAGTNVLLSPDQYNNLWVTVAECECE